MILRISKIVETDATICNSTTTPDGQEKHANHVILQGLIRMLEEEKWSWDDKSYLVLWWYQTTSHSATRGSPC